LLDDDQLTINPAGSRVRENRDIILYISSQLLWSPQLSCHYQDIKELKTKAVKTDGMVGELQKLALSIYKQLNSTTDAVKRVHYIAESKKEMKRKTVGDYYDSTEGTNFTHLHWLELPNYVFVTPEGLYHLPYETHTPALPALDRSRRCETCQQVCSTTRSILTHASKIPGMLRRCTKGNAMTAMSYPSSGLIYPHYHHHLL